MDMLKRRLARAFWFTLAVIFLIESWLWDHVRDWLRAFGRLLDLARYEPALAQFVGRHGPHVALAMFAAPLLVIYPLKLAALGMIAHGQVCAGGVLFLVANGLALGVSSFLFDHCRPKLLEMRWFATLYSIVLSVRAWAHDLVEPLRRHLRRAVEPVRERLAALLNEGKSQFLRNFARLRALARRS